MFTRPFLIGFVAASTLLGAGCSSDEPKKVTPTNQAPSPSATSTVGPRNIGERDALTAYRGMWDAVVEAGKTSDPEDPNLRKYASDQALRLIVSSLYTDRDQKHVSLGELQIDPKVTEVRPTESPNEATIVDCVNDEKWLKYKASGGLVNNVPGGRHRTTATAKRTPDGWKVASFILKEAGTC